jgi:hypothetical protein
MRTLLVVPLFAFAVLAAASCASAPAAPSIGSAGRDVRRARDFDEPARLPRRDVARARAADVVA